MIFKQHHTFPLHISFKNDFPSSFLNFPRSPKGCKGAALFALMLKYIFFIFFVLIFHFMRVYIFIYLYIFVLVFSFMRLFETIPIFLCFLQLFYSLCIFYKRISKKTTLYLFGKFANFYNTLISYANSYMKMHLSKMYKI